MTSPGVVTTFFYSRYRIRRRRDANGRREVWAGARLRRGALFAQVREHAGTRGRSNLVCNHVRMMEGSPRYDHPPVRSTTLTVFVEPIENFDLAIILPLQQRWSERFPALAQSYPRRRPPELPSVDALGSSGWPLPAVEQVDRSLSRTISYQHDQISLEWTFDLEAVDSAYPGFAVLSAELSLNFAYFVEVVQRLGDKPLKVQGCRCMYENRFDGVEGEDWIAGYISDWQNLSATKRMGGAEYVGFRLKEASENSALGTLRTVRSELDAGPEVGTTRFDIDVVSVALPESAFGKDSPADAARLLLEDAHELLIDTFAHSASDAMRAKWGVRQ